MIIKRVYSIDKEITLLSSVDSTSVDNQTLNWGYLTLGWYHLLEVQRSNYYKGNHLTKSYEYFNKSKQLDPSFNKIRESGIFYYWTYGYSFGKLNKCK